MLSITSGPFTGHVVPARELNPFTENDTHQPLAGWHIRHRLALFWSKHSPADGWRIETNAAPTEIALSVWDGDRSNASAPAWRFVAALYRNDKLVMTASSMRSLAMENAYENGENNALSRLLDHWGLPAVFNLTQSEWDELNHSTRPPSADTQRQRDTKGVSIVADYPLTGELSPPKDAVVDSSPAVQPRTADPEPASTPVVTQLTPRSKPATTGVSKATRTRLLNLHRRVKAGEDFEEPTSEQEALERIATLEDAVENRA
jgi:hypothetical protein